LAAPKAFEIRFSGEQLDQSDCDVFMQFMYGVRGGTLREPIQLNRADFLGQIERADSGKNYEWLGSVAAGVILGHLWGQLLLRH
jgi:hypothetical protein